LVEPDSNHDSLQFLPRVKESLIHYSTAFRALEILLQGQETERRILETAFFGKEIANIIAAADAQRMERHQRHEDWMKRISQIGFTPLSVSEMSTQIQESIRIQNPFEIYTEKNMMLLGLEGVPILAGLAYEWR
jgi:hypothetical protein